MNPLCLTIVVSGDATPGGTLRLGSGRTVVDVINASGQDLDDPVVKVQFNDEDYDPMMRVRYRPERWTRGQSLPAVYQDPQGDEKIREIEVAFKGEFEGRELDAEVELDRDDIRGQCVGADGRCVYRYEWRIP